MTPLPKPLVSTDWLARNLGAPDLAVLDASWYLPAQKRDARTDYESAHIPGALFFDIDAMSDQASPLPHMLPAPGEFARKAGALGIGSDGRIVVYDGTGLFSAPRVWWMFRAMGHGSVAVLDGGLPKWRAETRPLESGAATRPPRHFFARFRPELVRDREAVRSGGALLIDARSEGRFAGTEPEPRPGLRSGRVPGSRNLPFQRVARLDGTIRPPAELKSLFTQAGIDVSRPLVASCGSGVTACALALALETIGVKDVPVYDGSWAEWGADPSLPVETGLRES